MPLNLSQSDVDRNKSSQIRSACKSLTAAFVLLILPVPTVTAAELHIGGATVSTNPDERVALSDQMHTRIARTIESPATATALAGDWIFSKIHYDIYLPLSPKFDFRTFQVTKLHIVEPLSPTVQPACLAQNIR